MPLLKPNMQKTRAQSKQHTKKTRTIETTCKKDTLIPNDIHSFDFGKRKKVSYAMFAFQKRMFAFKSVCSLPEKACGLFLAHHFCMFGFKSGMFERAHRAKSEKKHVFRPKNAHFSVL